VSQDRRLCTSRAQASEHEWHPMQRSILGVVRIFMALPPYNSLYYEKLTTESTEKIPINCLKTNIYRLSPLIIMTEFLGRVSIPSKWIPAFAGMTTFFIFFQF